MDGSRQLPHPDGGPDSVGTPDGLSIVFATDRAMVFLRAPIGRSPIVIYRIPRLALFQPYAPPRTRRGVGWGGGSACVFLSQKTRDACEHLSGALLNRRSEPGYAICRRDLDTDFEPAALRGPPLAFGPICRRSTRLYRFFASPLAGDA